MKILPVFGTRALSVAAVLLTTFSVLAQAIYPDDHWTYSTQLTKENFESTIQTEIDSGRTMFAFAGNPDVSFGDVNLREESISGPPYNPGQGGWPTIRYFNKETGVEGKPYEKKTDKAMCDELGDEEMMTAYVFEAGGTSFCKIENQQGCNEKEIGYINKMKGKTVAERKTQLERLENMKNSSMKVELKSWLVKRKAILQQFTTTDTEEL